MIRGIQVQRGSKTDIDPRFEPWLVSESAMFLQSTKKKNSLENLQKLRKKHNIYLKHIDQIFKTHSFESDAERDEHTSSSHSSTAMNCDWSFLPKLLFRFVNLSNEINKAFTGLGNRLFRPISKLELSDGS